MNSLQAPSGRAMRRHRLVAAALAMGLVAALAPGLAAGAAPTAPVKLELNPYIQPPYLPPVVGSGVNVVANVINRGTTTATNVAISIPVPSGVSLGNLQGYGSVDDATCSQAGGILSCTTTQLLPGRVLYLSANGRYTATGTQEFVATVSADQPLVNPASSPPISIDVVDEEADLVPVLGSQRSVVAPGEQVDLVFGGNNAGPTQTYGSTQTLILPEGVSLVPDSLFENGAQECTVEGQAIACVSESSFNVPTVFLKVTMPDELGPVAFTSTVAGANDPDHSNDSTTTTVEVVPAEADLSIDGYGPSYIERGASAELFLNVRNDGPTGGSDIVVTVSVPTGWQLVDPGQPNGCDDAEPGTVTCAVGKLGSNTSTQVRATFTSSASAPAASPFTAVVSGAAPEGADAGLNSWSKTIAVADPGAADLVAEGNVADPAVGNPGDQATFTLSARNESVDRIARSVVVSDVLPEGVQVSYGYVNVDGQYRNSCYPEADQRTIRCQAGDVGPSSTVTFYRFVQYGTPGSFSDVATISQDADDLVPGDESATATYRVAGAGADLRAEKTASVTQAVVGEPFTYTLGVDNQGSETATNTVVVDDVPANFAIDAATVTAAQPGADGCTVSGQHVSCDVGDLAEGTSAAVTVAVTPVAVGRTVTNTMVASSDTAEVVGGHPETSSVTLGVASPGTGLVGQIRSAATGQPIAGIQVRIYKDGETKSRAVTTDTDGRYRALNLAPGSYRVWFRDTSSGRWVSEYWEDAPTLAESDLLPVVAGQATTASATLASVPPKPIPGTLSGTVTSTGGAPIAGIQVRLYVDGTATGSRATTTATDGTYGFTKVLPGTYRLWFRDVKGNQWVSEYHSDASSLSASTPVVLANGQHRVVDAQLAPLRTR